VIRRDHAGLRVSILGLGAGPLGDPSFDGADALIGAALDLGINLFDTAPSYGLSEERLGRALATRRDEVVLSTKLGYGVEGVPDWTEECIRRGIDRALRILRTDHLELAHLHSCPPETLANEGILRALEDAVAEGKLRVAAYSGDGAGLRAAIDTGRFGALQVSHNLVDQRALETGLPTSAVLAKRTLLNAAWSRPDDHRPDVAEYRRRFAALPPMDDVAATALRFTAFTPGISGALVGTTRVANLRANVAALEKGDLAPEEREVIREVYLHHRWPGLT